MLPKQRVPLADGPARDSRFQVVEQWTDCHNFGDGDARREVEFFHRQMNEEVNGMECAARALADFPDAEWELRLCIARQCSDEARHVEMFRGLFEARGGQVGEHPVLNFQFRIITYIDNLPGRLAVQNRSFETEGIDAVEPEIRASKERGDATLSRLFDAQLADEICHVRFANDYLADLAKRRPASVMQIGRALNYGAEAFLQVMGPHAMEGVHYPVNREGRIEAGFGAEEIEQATSIRNARLASRKA